MCPLELNALTKWYGPVRGIEDVTLSLDRGEVFGYLGPNGAGKTTTLRCLMGLIRPSRGDCRLWGETVIPGGATAHVRVGYLPGEFRFWPAVSADSGLSLLAALGGNASVARRRAELAERLRLDGRRPSGQLSKGNRQKVGLIGAFQHDPELLILDEPTSGLDPLMRQVALELIREAAGRGATVLLSSHDLSEVEAICGRAGILRGGLLVEVAPISRIVQQGEHRLKVWFREPTLEPSLPEALQGEVRCVERQPGMVHLAHRGSADAVLKWLAGFPVDRITTPQTSLEEAFMQYYRDAPESPARAGEPPDESLSA